MYRTLSSALIALAVLALGAVAAPPLGRALATTDAAESASAIVGNAGRFGRHLTSAAHPSAAARRDADLLTLQDFAGRWWLHGLALTIAPDGTGDAEWRRGGAGVDIGKATLRVDRVEGRTLYGTVLATNYADSLVRGPFELTEYDYGIGELSDARVLGARAIGAPEDSVAINTLCGPRYADAPAWVKRIRPCGA